MNLGNVVKSFFLGLGIGVLVLVVNALRGGGSSDIAFWALSVLASGGIGLLIGLATEWLTSLLPIRLARTRMYFLINGAIALVVTAIIVGLLAGFAGGAAEREGWWPIIGIIISAVAVANVVDYLLYLRTQARLRAFQERLPALDRAESDSE